MKYLKVSHKVSKLKLILYGLIWVVVWDLIHIYASPDYSLSINIFIGLIAGLIFRKNTIKETKLINLFNIGFLIFLIAVSPGLSYLLASIILSFYLGYSIFRKSLTRKFSYFIFLLPILAFWVYQTSIYELTNAQYRDVAFQEHLDYEWQSNQGSIVSSQDSFPRLISVWGLGCKACLEEMHMLDELSQNLKGKAQVISVFAIHPEKQEASLAYYQKMLPILEEKHELTFVLDSTARFYDLKNPIPQVYITDESNKVLLFEIGYHKLLRSKKYRKYKGILKNL
jgi:thiol-disulfide isomerase/thioredoxin